MVMTSARDCRITFNMDLWEEDRSGSGLHQMAQCSSHDLPQFKKDKITKVSMLNAVLFTK